MEAILTLLLSHSEVAIVLEEDEYCLSFVCFQWDAFSYLENFANEGSGLFSWKFPEGKALSVLGHDKVQPGDLKEGTGTILRDPISSYWINPMPVKCKF